MKKTEINYEAYTPITMHNLKTWPDIFKVMKTGEKNFEIRENDRNFKVDDHLTLHEFDPITEIYSGDKIHARITYILPSDNPFHDLNNKVILALKYYSSRTEISENYLQNETP